MTTVRRLIEQLQHLAPNARVWMYDYGSVDWTSHEVAIVTGFGTLGQTCQAAPGDIGLAQVLTREEWCERIGVDPPPSLSTPKA